MAFRTADDPGVFVPITLFAAFQARTPGFIDKHNRDIVLDRVFESTFGFKAFKHRPFIIRADFGFAKRANQDIQ
jgi:hypothetical protein